MQHSLRVTESYSTSFLILLRIGCAESAPSLAAHYLESALQNLLENSCTRLQDILKQIITP